MTRILTVMSIVYLLAMVHSLQAQTPLGTDFTYQGQLKASGLPAISTADFEFRLFNADAAGTQVASTLSKPNVAITNGLFTLPLDFGAAAFNGEARWLEVAVRCPAGAGNFATLNPRQQLTATPYALQTRGIAVDQTGRVGIGTNTPGSVIPSSKLDVVGGDVVVSNGSGFFSRNGPGTGIGAGIKSTGAEDLEIFTGGQTHFIVGLNGHVAIGDVSPLSGVGGGVHIRNVTDSLGGTLALEGTNNSAFLTVFPHTTVPAFGPRGAFGFLTTGTTDLTIANEGGGHIVLSDSGGTHLPACGEESLRIVRGSVLENAPDIGSGFSVTNGTTYPPGDHIITFSAPFSATPTVTATPLVTALTHTLIAEVDATHVEIITYDDDHSPQPGSFAFIAIGPR